ncbi:MAG: hypothetical protein EPO19_16640 [Betaproteobacteria bacterium]|nr:MAG: hypothetical protein EPO19_16640 [Betaproteobacteria bacterium]
MSQAALRPCWNAAAEGRAPAEQQRLRLEGRRRVSLVRRQGSARTLEVRLLRPATSVAETAGETERSIAAHLSKELRVPVQAGFHDRLPYVGHKTLRVVDEKKCSCFGLLTLRNGLTQEVEKSEFELCDSAMLERR